MPSASNTLSYEFLERVLRKEQELGYNDTAVPDGLENLVEEWWRPYKVLNPDLAKWRGGVSAALENYHKSSTAERKYKIDVALGILRERMLSKGEFVPHTESELLTDPSPMPVTTRQRRADTDIGKRTIRNILILIGAAILGLLAYYYLTLPITPQTIVIVVEPTLNPSSTPRVIIPLIPTVDSVSTLPKSTSAISPTAERKSTVPLLAGCPASNSTIDWSVASACVGQIKTVCGLVADASYQPNTNGRPTFLSIGNPFPITPRFTVLIWGENRGKYPQAPEELYGKREICATGQIVVFNGLAEIEVVEPAQISVR